MKAAPHAFHIEQTGEYFTPVLEYHGGGVFRCSPCRCVDQAAHTATRGETRSLAFHGVFRWQAGQLVSVPVDLTCPVDRRCWSWSQHAHTHGALGRNTRRTA